MVFFSCKPLLYSNKKTFAEGIRLQPYDAIIVPGFPFTEQPWHNVVKMRVVWAKYLYDKGYAKNIIFSGSSVYSPYIESKIMALYAQGMGIPKEHIFTEEKAEHSTENIYYSYVLAKRHGFKNIALASDMYQTSNLIPFVKKYELNIKFIPVIIDTLIYLNKTEPKIDKNLAYVENFVALPKRQSLYERLRGTIGKHIIWHEEDLKKKIFIKKYKNRVIPTDSIM